MEYTTFTTRIMDETTFIPQATEYTTDFSGTTATEDERFENVRTLSAVDIVLIVMYLLISLGVGLWASRSSSRRSVKGYFLAGQTMPWWPVGASLFASNIGTGHFIGLAGSGAANGIAIGSFEWLAPFELILLGWIFLPIYMSCRVYTMPEYLEKRYGGQRLRLAMSVISMILYVLTKIAVDMYAGALFIQLALGINLYLAVVSLLVITAIYTVLGGLKAVIYTDAMQTVVMLIGGLLVTILSFIKIGGYSGLEEKYMEAIPETTSNDLSNASVCGLPREDSFHIFRHPTESDLPWPGMLSGIFLLGSWYWCTDQVIVQRVLSVNSLRDAKAGCVLAGFLKIIPMYMIVMTGMISRVLFPNEVACSNATECQKICQNPEGCSNIAYPMLVLDVLPQGLRGIMVAAMLAALMSSLTSIFNSASTIFTLDIWLCFRKNASVKEQLIVGKITVIILVIVSILWIPILLTSAGGQLFIYLQAIQSALGPPIFGVYVFGIMLPRVNEKGAFWGLIIGISGGMIRLILDFSHKPPGCGEEEYRPAVLYRVNYLYVSSIVFAAEALVMFVISYMTEPPNESNLVGTTWKYIDAAPKQSNNELKKLNGDVESEGQKEEPATAQISSIGEETQPVENEEEPGESEKVNVNPEKEKPPEQSRSSFWLNIAAGCLLIFVTFLMGYYG